MMRKLIAISLIIASHRVTCAQEQVIAPLPTQETLLRFSVPADRGFDIKITPLSVSGEVKGSVQAPASPSAPMIAPVVAPSQQFNTPQIQGSQAVPVKSAPVEVAGQGASSAVVSTPVSSVSNKEPVSPGSSVNPSPAHSGTASSSSMPPVKPNSVLVANQNKGDEHYLSEAQIQALIAREVEKAEAHRSRLLDQAGQGEEGKSLWQKFKDWFAEWRASKKSEKASESSSQGQKELKKCIDSSKGSSSDASRAQKTAESGSSTSQTWGEHISENAVAYAVVTALVVYGTYKLVVYLQEQDKALKQEKRRRAAQRRQERIRQGEESSNEGLEEPVEIFE